jgi:hypothetical protein
VKIITLAMILGLLLMTGLAKAKLAYLAVMMAFLVSDDDLLRFQIYTKEKVTLLVQTIELYAGTNKLPCINIRQVA